MRLLSALLLLALATTAQAQLATPNPAGLTYGHVHLNVVDMDRHKEIWVEHFNGVVVQKGPLTAAVTTGAETNPHSSISTPLYALLPVLIHMSLPVSLYLDTPEQVRAQGAGPV